MITLKDREAEAIRRLKFFEPPEGYYLGYSGGKDSDVILALAKLAGVKFHAVHNHTTVDAPETVYYVRKMRDDPENHLTISYPKRSMWRMIVEKRCLPTRRQRFCCEELKERGGAGELCIFGVRREESVARAANGGLIMVLAGKTAAKIADEEGAEWSDTPKAGIVLNVDDAPTRRVVEQCYRTHKSMINPIVEWSESEVWAFLKHYGIEANPLYSCGYHRVGCVGCPMSRNSKCEFERYPKYAENYLRTIGRMLEARAERGWANPDVWGGKDATPESVFAWWVEDEHFGQYNMFDEGSEK